MHSERHGPTLEVRIGSGFDVLAGAARLASGEPGPAWPSRLDQRVATELAERAGDPTGEVWLHLLAAATDLPGEPDTAAVAAWLTHQDARQLRRAVVGADVPAWQQVLPADLLTAVAEGQPEAVSRALADERYYAGKAAAALRVLGPLDPEQTRRRLVTAFDRLREALPGGLEAELSAAQWAFVRDRLPPAGTDPLAVLDETAGGFEWTPEPGITRLVLVPHLAAAPALLLLQHRDARVVGVPAATDDTPAPARLAAAYAAAGDEQRLRILQLLAHRALGVSEVARRLDIAKSTAHHHLGALRRAGLIRLTGRAWRYAYRTRDDAPEVLAARLRRLLATPPDGVSGPVDDEEDP